MADPLSIASGLVTLAAFALQSSITLYQVIESFKSSKKTIRELKEELEALHGVLTSLEEIIASNDDHLSGLKLPLLRCGKACKDFETIIVKCTAHSGGPRKSFRDWAKLQYMGDDIIGFKNMLAGYKSTISIALGDANVRTAAVTVDVLRQYKTMITNTTSDLEEHLQEIDNKLQNLFLQDARLCDEDVVRSEQIQEERDSTAQCLRICAEVSKHMDEVQPKAFEGTRTASAARQAAMASLQDYLSASRMTGNTLKECKERLANTISELEKHDQDLSKRLNNHPREAIMPGEQAAEQERIQEEKNSIEQCLSICTKAAEQADQVRINIVEDLTVAQDSHQVVVATLGDLISAKRISAGPRSTQWMGQMSDETLQQLSRDRVHITAEKDMNPPSETTEEFEGRHGAGYKVGRVKKGN